MPAAVDLGVEMFEVSAVVNDEISHRQSVLLTSLSRDPGLGVGPVEASELDEPRNGDLGRAVHDYHRRCAPPIGPAFGQKWDVQDDDPIR